jgi:hypothetical protein
LSCNEIHCTFKPYLGIKEFLSLLQYLKPDGKVILDIPLKGRVRGFFRPVERAMQRAGIPCRPSRDALVKGKLLSSKIESLGFRTIEMYPFEFYKFFNLVLPEKFDIKRVIHIQSETFRKSFPPYKRAGRKGIKNAERIIQMVSDFLGLRLVISKDAIKKQNIKWDIYDSIFGAFAGYLLCVKSPWARIFKDETGAEILLLCDDNLRISLTRFSAIEFSPT